MDGALNAKTRQTKYWFNILNTKVFMMYNYNNDAKGISTDYSYALPCYKSQQYIMQ